MELVFHSKSWTEYDAGIRLLGRKERGSAFEVLCKMYFEVHPPLAKLYSHVWLWQEVPDNVREQLSLPSQDLGIDILCKAEDGFHAVQCKFHADPNKSVTFKEVSTFLTLFEANPKITQGYICTTADLESRNLEQVRSKNIQLILSDTWEGLDEKFFKEARNKLSGKELKLDPYQPRTHQKKALKQAKKHFIDNDEKRGKLIFPCGSGKSLTGYWITENLQAKSTIIAVPSLALVKQTLSVYIREVVAKKRNVKWLCICSDEGIGKGEDVSMFTENIGVPCITDQQYIKSWLQKHQEDEIYIFTTYQSGRIIGEVSKELGFTFDLGIFDEAHKTVGSKEKLFSYLLFDENIDVRKRVFMTATERFYSGKKDDIVSMDDESVYGEIFAHMSFKEAMQSDHSLLTDYKVITLQVTDEEIADFIKENGLVQLNDKWKNETEARSLASMIALRKAMLKYPIRNAVSFHSSIEKAKRNKEIHTYLTQHYDFPPIETYTVSGKLPTTRRTKIVNEFAKSERALITNARCLTEGVDVPNIDCIVFADPKRSKIDIVQALGRALRKKEGKEWGYVVLPVIFDEEKKEVDNKSFNDILAVVRALAANDERIIEELRDKSNGTKIGGNQIDQFDFEVMADSINADQLKEELEIRLWDNIAKLNWRPFEEARNFVRSLKLNNGKEWRKYIAEGLKPSDIPSNPNQIYSSQGWQGMGDWLGTGRIANFNIVYIPFEEARNFARTLGLGSNMQWRDFVKSGKLPSGIPSKPDLVYGRSNEWKSWNDWLNTNNKLGKITTEIFIKRSRKHHGNKYDYSKSKYITNSTEVIIICPIHGEFKQRPELHMMGRGCRKCSVKDVTWSTESLGRNGFEEKARQIHGDKYSYDKVNYTSNSNKVIITCPKHGDFLQSPQAHLKKQGCRKCFDEQKYKERVELFLRQAKDVHGTKFSYDKVVYKDRDTKVIITCPEHGDFNQQPGNHLAGNGCPLCSNMRWDTKIFIQNAKQVHGNWFDYSNSIFTRKREPINVICKKHGPFMITAAYHIQNENGGCKECAKRSYTKRRSPGIDFFLHKARQAHGERYDYSEVEYINKRTKVKIICNEHGPFMQNPSIHYGGSGCPICARQRKKND